MTERKKMKSIFLVILMFLYLTAGAAAYAQNHGGKKILVAYFSHGGNTRVVAEMLQHRFSWQKIIPNNHELNQVVDDASNTSDLPFNQG
jgi:hypothetical protein